MARNRLAIVLKFNMFSLAIKYVNAANIVVDIPKAISFEDHNKPVESTIFLVPAQKHKHIGIAKISTETRGLSFHHSQTNCELN